MVYRPQAGLETGYFIRFHGNVAMKYDGKSISGARSDCAVLRNIRSGDDFAWLMACKRPSNRILPKAARQTSSPVSLSDQEAPLARAAACGVRDESLDRDLKKAYNDPYRGIRCVLRGFK